HGFAGPGLAFDEQRTFEHDRGVNGDLEVIGGDVVFGSGKFHRVFALLLILVRRGALRPRLTPSRGSSQLATSAPMMPTTMFPISPKPAPRTISPASQPAIAPITSAAMIPIDNAP